MNAARHAPTEPPAGGRSVATREDVEDMLLLGGGLFELRDGDAQAALAAVRAELDARIADDLVVGASGRLDPGDALNAMIKAGLDGRSDFWRSRYVATGRRLVCALAGRPSSGPPDLMRLEPRRVDLRFRRTFNLSGLSGPLRLRLPLPVEDAQLTELSLELDRGGSAQASRHPGRLELKIDGSGVEAVSLGVRLSFTVRPQARLAVDEAPAHAQALWLAPREGAPLVGERVTALAAGLAVAADKAATVLAFRDHLLDAFTCGVVLYEQLGADPLAWVLERRWYDCRLGALLLVALCRASAIPARLVGGYLLWDAPMEHYWMEAWLPDRGWTPFDLLAWDLSAGGRDVGWRDFYAGALDYRMKTQVFPQVFTGAPGVPMTSWRRISRAIRDGVRTEMVSAEDGRPLYSDELVFLR